LKTKAIYFLYRLLQALGFPVLLLYFVLRGFRQGAYFLSLRQRLGILPRSYQQTVPGAIWLHAVSVGEVLSSVELVRQLASMFPLAPVFVSCSTLAGYAAGSQKLREISARVFYAPVDYAFAVRHVLRRLRPSVVIIVETEIWPNLFREAKRFGCGLVIINGRISDRAAPKYFHKRWFFRHVLCWPDCILAQTQEMRDRFVRAGAPPELVRIGGNLKYDIRPAAAGPESPVIAVIGRVRRESVWFAASTMPPGDSGVLDEDVAVIAAFRQLSAIRPGLLLLLAPRRPERFDVVARKLDEAGIAYVRRSELAYDSSVDLPGVLLLDSIGELAGLFPAAAVVFMGGTLANRGGHNILEPAIFARPVIIGPHMENFEAIADEFRARDACVQIDRPDQLAGAVDRLLRAPSLAARIGTNALACAEERRGGTRIAVEEIRRRAIEALPCCRPPFPVLILLGAKAALWVRGGRRRFTRDLARRKRLDAPTISIGNISVGGTGKTPFTLHLAESLKRRGRKPAILTRGYGRQSPDKYLILGPGENVSVGQSGDEPHMYLEAGVAPVGIGPDRYRAGRLVEQRFDPDVFLLDDAFQHARLERQLDIVLIDGLDPFDSCAAVPLGRLREPLEGLRRAGLFVITRSDYARIPGSAEYHLARYNPHAPVFHARVLPEYWVGHATGERVGARELPSRRVAAFCGLGNPASFWATLDSLGLETIERFEFADHHHYTPQELRRMAELCRAAKVDLLLTTEKDTLNLCDDCDVILAPIRVYWLKIRKEIDGEAALMNEIDRYLVLVK
jgi:3-deoxy-D-manno-octulosonic-acid transferase